MVTCRTCGGSGAKPGTRRVPCPQCGGRGVVSRSHGIFQITTTCPRCQGMKEFFAEACPDCNGEGRIREKKKIKVKIPPGMDSGTHLVMPGEGNGGAYGGPPGDLYIVLDGPAPRAFPAGRATTCTCRCPFPLSRRPWAPASPSPPSRPPRNW